MRGMLSSLGTALLVSLAAVVPSAITAQSHVVPATQPSESKKVALASGYGKLPLSFEANHGQTDPQVRFLSRGNGYSLFLTDRAAVLSLRRPDVSPAAKASLPSRLAPKQPATFKTDVVRMELSGASRNLHVSGDNKLPGTANYFIGNDPAKWHSAVPTYARVKYDHVYPGVDLVYYGNQSQLEYDFVVAPNADPKSIRLHFAGASTLKLDKNGDLEVIAKKGQIAFHKPVVYQQIAGQRKEVEGRFTLLARNKVAFGLGDYDHSKEVVIDPTLAYSTYLGGSSEDFAVAIAVDAAGEAFVTGQTSDADFPTTPGSYETTSSSTAQLIFVSKFNSLGTALLYSTYFGVQSDGSEPGNDATSIAVDGSGNAYVTGYTSSTDFPVTPGAFQTTLGAAPNGNAFVFKLNASGTGLVYATYLGGSKSTSYVAGDSGYGIAVDQSGNAYIAGGTTSTDFPVKAAFQASLGSPYGNAFISKLNSTGTALVYSTYLGGSAADPGAIASDTANAITVDAAGNAYVTGLTSSTNFPLTPGVYQSTNAGAGGSNAFVSKLNPAGNALVFSTYLGGSGSPALSPGASDSANAIALGSGGQVYISGSTDSVDFPVSAGAFQSLNNDHQGDTGNAFVSEFSASGSTLLYSTYLGGLDALGATSSGIAVNSSGMVYVTGSTNSTNFPTTANAYQASNRASNENSNNSNVFVVELNPQADGTASLVYATYLGGSIGDSANALAADDSGGVYVAGQANSPDFPTVPGSFQTTNNTYGNGIGSADASNAFISKFAFGSSAKLATTTSLTSDGNPQNFGTRVTFTAYVQPSSGTGIPTGTVTFTIDGTAGSPVTLDSTGHATYATSSLSVGSHTLTAAYSGDTTYSPSTSSTLTESITSLGIATTPAFSPVAGTYSSAQSVKITGATAGSVIYYTTNGSTPSTSSTKYSAAIAVSASETLKAIAVAPGYSQSAVATAAYTIQVAGTPAVLTAPAAGSTLSTSATFTWTAGTGVTAYQLWLGTTAGASNLYNSHGTLSLSETVTGLPANGGTIFATLFSQINGVYKSNAYTFIASGTPSPATLTSPAPGSKFTGTSATFAWAAGTGVTAYQLWLGSTPGAKDLFNSGGTSNLSVAVTGLPSNGGTIFATLFSLIDGAYKGNSYTYTAVGTPAQAVLSTPAPGSTLTGSSATFTWTAGTGVTNYQLWLGTMAGSNNLYNSSGTYNHSVTVTGLPTNGGTIFATLFSLIDGVYKSNAYTYIASGTAAPAVLSTPAPGSKLSGSSVTFDWTAGTGVTAYQLWVGSTAGASDLYNSHGTDALSATVTGLPTNGKTIYVTLFSLIDGTYKSNAYTYTETGP